MRTSFQSTIGRVILVFFGDLGHIWQSYTRTWIHRRRRSDHSAQWNITQSSETRQLIEFASKSHGIKWRKQFHCIEQINCRSFVDNSGTFWDRWMYSKCSESCIQCVIVIVHNGLSIESRAIVKSSLTSSHRTAQPEHRVRIGAIICWISGNIAGHRFRISSVNLTFWLQQF